MRFTPMTVRQMTLPSSSVYATLVRSFWPSRISVNMHATPGFIRRHFLQSLRQQRYPGGSSGGSGSSVGANLVTCAIAEETGASIRTPARHNSSVGIAPTQELVSRDGMIGAGLNTRTGPICRTVADAALVLDVIAGYDPKDELTVFSVGRTPAKPYQSYAHEKSLKGVRIGVVREYMDKSLFTQADFESIDIVDRALADLRKLEATIVDPGPGGALMQQCLMNTTLFESCRLRREFPDLYPVDAQGKPARDHVATVLDMTSGSCLFPRVHCQILALLVRMAKVSTC
jgi:Asp-tRNA(Asn)/Glu-tRNA(Gln) amidotransferase A subunit family amidase